MPSFSSILPTLQVPPGFPPIPIPPVNSPLPISNIGSNNRPRSNSKRRRTEDGYVQEPSVQQPGQKESKNHNKGNGKPKPIVGTSDSSANGRKMRTPPADIFVWGVHPSTTKEDIVSDLEISGIKISACDIEKKSNAEAKLCSYRISVPAPLLEKALDPGIWPLRVKVREFIHYSNRPKQSRANEDKESNQSSSERSMGAAGSSSTGL